jgi:glucose/mannose transport system substrate-binding protein
MQFNTGKQFDELVSDGLLNDVESVAEAAKLRQVLPPAIVDAVTRNGKFYAIPVNIHGINWLWYNKKDFDQAGLAEPKTWADVEKAGEKLKAQGLIGLAQGGQPWQERTLFNSVLVGEGGTDLYYQIYRDKKLDAVKGPKFREVAELYKKLHDLVDPGSPGRNWNDATALVITNKAAMHFNGDWAKGEFIAAGQTAGKEYGCTVVGREPKLQIGGDVFVFPVTKDKAVLATQDKMIDILLDPTTQIEFNKKKGSIPVRMDVDVSSMDVCAQKSHAVLSDPANQVEAMELISTPNFSGAMQDAVTQYWNNPNMSADAFIEKVLGAMRDAS